MLKASHENKNAVKYMYIFTFFDKCDGVSMRIGGRDGGLVL